jgi:hypothetical protein
LRKCWRVYAVEPGFYFLKGDAQAAKHWIRKRKEDPLAGDSLGVSLELFVMLVSEGISPLLTVTDYLARLGFRLVRRYPAQDSFYSQCDFAFLA